MKVLLLNQPWICDSKKYGVRAGVRWAHIRERDRSTPYFPFPFSLAYATSYLASRGIQPVLRDSIALEETKEQALAYIRHDNFDVVVLETSTASIAIDMAFCDELKSQKPGTVVCMVGQHSTAMPEDVLRSCAVDYVLIGEYDRSLFNLVIALAAQQPIERMRGIAFRQGDIIINNGREELVPFDDLPPPYRDRNLVRKYNESPLRGFPNLPMLTSRGCSYKCTFCIEAVVNYGARSNFRYRSMEKVVAEMRSLIDDYGVQEIYFDDAFFTPRHAEEVSKTILDNKLKLFWSCWIDRSTSQETLALMRKSGCSGVKFGVETFDETIGLGVKKKVVPKVVKDLVGRCRRAGLLTHASFIFGLPGETKESMKHTLQSAMALGTSTTQFSVATPLPGTEFFEQAKQNNWLTTYDWSRYEGGGNSSVLKYDDLTPEDLKAAVRRARKLKILRLFKDPRLLAIFTIKTIKMMGFRGFLADASRKAVFLARN